MRTQQNGILRYILIIFLVFALVRFYPVVMRTIQAAASGASLYWWAALPVLVIGWAFWKMFRRGLVAKKSGYPVESQPYRDVTDSAQNPSEKK